MQFDKMRPMNPRGLLVACEEMTGNPGLGPGPGPGLGPAPGPGPGGASVGKAMWAVAKRASEKGNGGGDSLLKKGELSQSQLHMHYFLHLYTIHCR